MTSAHAMAPSMRTPLVMIAMLAVAASFAATVGCSQLELGPIGDQAQDILNNGTPSIEHLSGIETELMLLGLRTNEYADRADTHLRDEIMAGRRRIDTEVASYRALPSFPGESERMDRIVADLAVLDGARDAVLSEADAGSLDAAVKAEFYSRLERVADEVARLRELNAAHVMNRGAGIVAARRNAQRVVAVLGALSVLISVLAKVLVDRKLRSRERVVQVHNEVLTARAAEMEAFAGRVAHDLRNPLSAIGLCLAAVQGNREQLPQPAHDNLGKASRQVDRMAAIIDGLLEFAHAGANPTPGTSADLATVLDDVLTEVGPAAAAAHAELEIDEFPPTKLACTPHALASVLANLLGNALKYGACGANRPARIAVRVGELERAAQVEIVDNGQGLPPGSEQLVFEPFRQLSTGRSGIGLGLATVKKLVEAYGGRVGVRSTPGRGSAFWFELPKAA